MSGIDVVGGTSRVTAPRLSKGSAPAATSGQGEDRIDLNGHATGIEALIASAAALPEMRSDRVAALKAQVESGQYQVDSKAVAAKMQRRDR